MNFWYNRWSEQTLITLVHMKYSGFTVYEMESGMVVLFGVAVRFGG